MEVQRGGGERAAVQPEVRGERAVPRVPEVLEAEVGRPAPVPGRGDLAPHPGGEPGLVLGELGLARGGEGVATNALARLATSGRVISTRGA